MKQHKVTAKILQLKPDIPVSVEKTRKLLSQNPQATRNLLSTVVTKQFDLTLSF